VTAISRCCRQNAASDIRSQGAVLKVAKARKKNENPIVPKLGRRTTSTSGPGSDELARIALDLFAESHFASVSIRDIGRAAKINSAMIYYHFSDKADLICAAIESAIDEAVALFEKHCENEEHDTPADAISDWFDVHVALHKRLRNVIKISLDCRGIPEANEPILRFYRHEREILEKLIHEGIDNGIFHEVDSAVVATMISTMLDGVLARSMFLKDFEMIKTVQEFKRAIFLYLGYSGGRTDNTSSGILRKVDP
jgi:AcrR family transcriptional regulator